MPTTLRDALRERDLAARGVAAEVRVDGLRLVIEMDLADFDELIRPDHELHDECWPAELISHERDEAEAKGYSDAVADMRKALEKL